MVTRSMTHDGWYRLAKHNGVWGVKLNAKGKPVKCGAVDRFTKRTDWDNPPRKGPAVFYSPTEMKVAIDSSIMYIKAIRCDGDRESFMRGTVKTSGGIGVTQLLDRWLLGNHSFCWYSH